MALLDIIKQAASQLGLKQPSAVVGSTDLTAQILLRYANQGGKELAKYHDWQALIVERSFTSVATVVQTGAIPDDYSRMAKDVEIWNTTNTRRYEFPANARTWRRIQIGVTGGVVGWARLMGGELNIYPAPTAGETVEFEYISKNWVIDADDDTQALFMADTDESLIDEDLIVLECVWRYRHGRGFAQYAEDMATCEREKEKAASRDRAPGRITPNSNSGSLQPPAPFWDGTISE